MRVMLSWRSPAGRAAGKSRNKGEGKFMIQVAQLNFREMEHQICLLGINQTIFGLAVRRGHGCAGGWRCAGVRVCRYGGRFHF